MPVLVVRAPAMLEGHPLLGVLSAVIMILLLALSLTSVPHLLGVGVHLQLLGALGPHAVPVPVHRLASAPLVLSHLRTRRRLFFKMLFHFHFHFCLEGRVEGGAPSFDRVDVFVG